MARPNLSVRGISALGIQHSATLRAASNRTLKLNATGRTQTGGDIPAAVSFPMASCEAGRRRRFHLHPRGWLLFANFANPLPSLRSKAFNRKGRKDYAKETKKNHPSPPQPGYARRPVSYTHLRAH